MFFSALTVACIYKYTYVLVHIFEIINIIITIQLKVKDKLTKASCNDYVPSHHFFTSACFSGTRAGTHLKLD